MYTVAIVLAVAGMLVILADRSSGTCAVIGSVMILAGALFAAGRYFG